MRTVESWNQASIEEGRLQFFKNKILEELGKIRGDLGELRYKLYVETVNQCDDYKQLKEMAELELQLQFIEYAKGMVQEPLAERQVEINDLKKVYSTPQERENIGSEEDDLEGDDLLGMGEEEYQEALAAALRRGELFTPLSIDNPGDVNPADILAATLEEPTDEELARMLPEDDEEGEGEYLDEQGDDEGDTDFDGILSDEGGDEEESGYTEQETLDKINESILDNSVYNFQFFDTGDEVDAEETGEEDGVGTDSDTSDDTGEFLDGDSGEDGEGLEGEDESSDIDSWLDSNYGGSEQFLDEGETPEEIGGEDGEASEDGEGPSGDQSDDFDRWLDTSEDSQEGQGSGLVVGLFEDSESTVEFGSWFGTDSESEDEDIQDSQDGDEKPGLSDDSFFDGDEDEQDSEGAEVSDVDSFLDDEGEEEGPKTVWLGSGATPPVPSGLFPPAGKTRETAPPLAPRKIASKSIFTDRGTQKMFDGIIGMTGKTNDVAKKAVTGTRRMISEASKRIESSPDAKSFFELGNPNE